MLGWRALQHAKRYLRHVGRSTEISHRYSRSFGTEASTASPAGKAGFDFRWLAAPAALAAGLTGYSSFQGLQDGTLTLVLPEEETTLVNWSGTHDVQVKRLLQPHSVEELENIVAEAHQRGLKLRCTGSGLSPNGISFEPKGMVSLALLDKVLSIDKENMQVTVQAGARVQEVADALREHGMTLQNYASIREQTIGGFTQVSAHGTGARIPPVDETVVAMKVVTPAQGLIELSKARQPELFDVVRVGLGALGVVTEVTLQCVPAHHLLEHTFPATKEEVLRNHSKWLRQNQHIRYMWIPYTDTVVVVTNNPVKQGTPPPPTPQRSDKELRAPFVKLAKQATQLTEEELVVMSPTELRDSLLALRPLDVEWVKQVNAAEAEHWRMREGYRMGFSDQLLGFDCGGQQWVLEVAFPSGTADKPNGADMKYMEELLALIEQHNIPAHPPIEQRWTSSSSAVMSPSYGAQPSGLHSWVGIINYLPEGDETLRQQVTESFRLYAQHVTQQLMPKYGAAEHWAKIELPSDADQRAAMVKRVQAHYPTERFCRARKELDPHNILGNELVDTLFPMA